jgi:phospholipid/cholesterol/gamma-HCH transport system substrate-binding protein
METKANYVLIGFFTLAVLAGVLSFVHWFRSIGKAGSRAYYHVVFQGPVGGLRTGASVLFNGMRVGEVSNLQLAKHDPRQVVATINVDANVPVRRDTYVGLDYAGLTGIAAIGLRGGDLTAGPLPEGDEGLPVLVADLSATQDLSAAVRDVLRKVDQLVTENQQTLHTALTNVEAFTASLKGTAPRIESVLRQVDEAAGSLERVMGGVETLTGNAKKPGELTETVRAVKTAVDDFDKRTLRNVDALILDARRAIGTIEQVVKNFDRNPSRLIFGGGQAAPDVPTPAAAAPAPPARPAPPAPPRRAQQPQQ